MSRETKFLKLHLPDENEYYRVEEDQNQNFEKIDSKLKEIDTLLEEKEPEFEKNSAFNKDFGTNGDTVLEGSKYEVITGTNYGGSLNDAGIKEEGKTYWDNNTKALYLCKNNNSDTSANTRNFEPLDNKSLLNKVSNLGTNEVEIVYNKFNNYDEADIPLKRNWKKLIFFDKAGDYDNETSYRRALGNADKIIIERSVYDVFESLGIPYTLTISDGYSGDNRDYINYEIKNNKIVCTYSYATMWVIIGAVY